MPELKEVFNNAIVLPLHERAYLAQLLLESIDREEDSEITEKSMTEILRRCKEIDEGRVNLIPVEEAIARIRESIS